MPRTPRPLARLGAIAALAAAALLTTGAAPAAEAAPAGTTVAVTGTGIRLTLTIGMTTARSLNVTCNAAGKPVINGSALTVRCVDIRHLNITGSPGNDTLDLELRGFTRAISTAKLGTGYDTATARHKGDSEIRIYGEAGNDTISSGFDPSVFYNPNATDNVFGARDVLDGGPGNDRITSLGYLSTVNANPDDTFLSVALVGGPGTDTLLGSTNRPEVYDIDLDDPPFRPSTRPIYLALHTRDAAEQVLIHNDGNYGTQVTVTAGTARSFLDMPDTLRVLDVRTAGGDDRITVDHKSYKTNLRLDPELGANAIHLHPRNPYRWDASMGLVVQPGAGSWEYEYEYDSSATVTLDATWP